MSTKLLSKALLGVLSATVLAAPAFAGGNCNGGNCSLPVQVMPGYAPQFGPMTVQTQQPMGHLRSVNFQRAPHVSITRVHGLAPNAALSDAPSGFTGGCHPTSTTYCRQDAGVPVQVQLSAPAPTFAPAPVAVAPSEPQVVRVGGGYDPSKFTPRVYGDPTFVPGIAHVPTSIVDRDPVRAQQVLDSGRTIPQSVVVPGTGRAPQPHFQQQSFQPVQAPAFQAPVLRAPVRFAPQQRHLGFVQAGAPVLQQSGPLAGAYGSSVGSDGTYWEKVSGPTAFGDTIATSVICKRQAPVQQVVRPVIGVPVPVPVAVPYTVDHAQNCAPGHPHLNAQRSAPVAPHVPGRWIH